MFLDVFLVFGSLLIDFVGFLALQSLRIGCVRPCLLYGRVNPSTILVKMYSKLQLSLKPLFPDSYLYTSDLLKCVHG